MNTTLKFKVLGTTDDVTNCNCCGRQNLKLTVVLQPLDLEGGPDGDVVYFGTSCAAKAMKQTVKFVRDQISAVEAAERAARRAAEDAEFAAYCAWLNARYGVKDPVGLHGIGVAAITALKAYRAEKAA